MIEFLAKFELLQEVGDENRELLCDFLDKRNLRSDELLFQVGEEAAALYLVVDGELGLELEGEALGTVQAGETLGGASLVCIGNRQCDARARNPVFLLVLTRESYMRLSSEAPELAFGIQAALMREFAAAVRAVVSPV